MVMKLRRHFLMKKKKKSVINLLCKNGNSFNALGDA